MKVTGYSTFDIKFENCTYKDNGSNNSQNNNLYNLSHNLPVINVDRKTNKKLSKTKLFKTGYIVMFKVTCKFLNNNDLLLSSFKEFHPDKYVAKMYLAFIIGTAILHYAGIFLAFD